MKNFIFVDRQLLFPRNSVLQGWNSIPVYALVNNTAEQCRKMYQSTWSIPQPSKRIEKKAGTMDYAESLAIHSEGEVALVCCFQRIKENTIQRFLTEPSPSTELTQLLQLHYMRTFTCLIQIEKKKTSFSSKSALVYPTPELTQEDEFLAAIVEVDDLSIEIIENDVIKVLPPLTQNMINYFDFKLNQIVSSWDEAKDFDKSNPPGKMVEKWKNYATDFRAEAGR